MQSGIQSGTGAWLSNAMLTGAGFGFWLTSFRGLFGRVRSWATVACEK